MATVRATPDPSLRVSLARATARARARAGTPPPRRAARAPPGATRADGLFEGLRETSGRRHQSDARQHDARFSDTRKEDGFFFCPPSNARFPEKRKKKTRPTDARRIVFRFPNDPNDRPLPRPGFCPASPASAARTATRRPRLCGATARTAPRRCATRAACATTAGTPRRAARLRARVRASPRTGADPPTTARLKKAAAAAAAAAGFGEDAAAGRPQRALERRAPDQARQG